MKYITAIVIMASLTACTDAPKAVSVLTKAGYTEIKAGGYSAFACSQDDQYATKFSAKGPTGIPVEGVVCSGFTKGNTIRID